MTGSYIKVYSGTRDRCMCGCSGKYWEKGQKSFDRMVKKVLAMQPKVENSNMGDYAWVEVNERIYAVYTY
jgi:hypothetical protein